MPQPTFTFFGTIKELTETKQAGNGTLYKVLVASEGKGTVDYFPVTGWNEVGGTLARSVGKAVLIQCRLSAREWQGKYYLEVTADGVFQTAAAPQVADHMPDAGKADPPAPDFRPPSVRNAKPEPQATPPAVYGQEPEEQDDIPF